MKKMAILLAVGLVLAGGDAWAKKRGKKGRGAASGSLSSPEPAVAAAAAKALGSAKKSKTAVDQLLDALAMGLHPQVAASALEALAQQKKPVALDTAAFYCSHRNAKVRAAAVTAVAAIPGNRSERLLLQALSDWNGGVRGAAAEGLQRRKVKGAVEPLLALLVKGDAGSGPALAAMADPDLARLIAEKIGSAPDGLLARTLGAILDRKDFKPEEARVEVVRALGKVPGNDAIEQLTNYLSSTPENPPRQSRREAEALIEQRLSGD